MGIKSLWNVSTPMGLCADMTWNGVDCLSDSGTGALVTTGPFATTDPSCPLTAPHVNFYTCPATDVAGNPLNSSNKQQGFDPNNVPGTFGCAYPDTDCLYNNGDGSLSSETAAGTCPPNAAQPQCPAHTRRRYRSVDNFTAMMAKREAVRREKVAEEKRRSAEGFVGRKPSRSAA